MKLIIISILFATSVLTSTAQEVQDLFKEFPAMPASVSNNDLIALRNKKPLDVKYNKMLNALDEHDRFYPVGKIETKKYVILIYGNMRQSMIDKNPLMNGVIRTVDKKTGQTIPGGLQNYVFMSGEDAFLRKSNIKWDGTKFSVVIESFERSTGESKETDSSEYVISKDKLIFSK